MPQVSAIAPEDIGTAQPIICEEDFFAFMGFDHAGTEQPPIPTGTEEVYTTDLDEQDEEVLHMQVLDAVPGEGAGDYDRDDPPMHVGATYATMADFRYALRCHAIKGKFKVRIQKSEPGRFRGYCTGEGCPWAIVARNNTDGNYMRV